jgi:hypothetical protein
MGLCVTRFRGIAALRRRLIGKIYYQRLFHASVLALG